MAAHFSFGGRFCNFWGVCRRCVGRGVCGAASLTLLLDSLSNWIFFLDPLALCGSFLSLTLTLSLSRVRRFSFLLRGIFFLSSLSQ